MWLLSLFYILIFCSCISAYFTPVIWDSVTNKCVPDVCKERKIAQVPGFVGKINPDLLMELDLFDHQRTKDCFRGKVIVLMGDNLMKETLHDIIFLLSGVFLDHDLYHQYYGLFLMKQKKKGSEPPPDAKMVISVPGTSNYNNMFSFPF